MRIDVTTIFPGVPPAGAPVTAGQGDSGGHRRTWRTTYAAGPIDAHSLCRRCSPMAAVRDVPLKAPAWGGPRRDLQTPGNASVAPTPARPAAQPGSCVQRRTAETLPGVFARGQPAEGIGPAGGRRRRHPDAGRRDRPGMTTFRRSERQRRWCDGRGGAAALPNVIGNRLSHQA